MTFRRAMLVILPLLASIFVFMVLRWVYLEWEASLVGRSPLAGGRVPEMPAGKEEMPAMPNVGHEVSTNVNLVRRDREGRPTLRLIADRIEHQTSNTAEVERPRIQFFTRGGEIITLMAERAHMVTKGSMLKMEDIESGRLWGYVVLVHDRGTPDDHSDDLLAGFDDLTFTDEMYELATDGPVLMAGLEMDLTARKMRMTMDRKTRRISTMTVLEDIHISMSVGDRMRMALMTPMEEPGGASPVAVPSGKGPPAATPAPPTTTAPTGGVQESAEPAPEKEGGELWRIDLAGDVDARQQDQRLLCDHLSLYNRASGAVMEPAAQPPATETGGGADVQGQSPPTPEAPPETSAEPDLRKEGMAAARAKFLEPGAPPPLVVMARGPLIIMPVGPAESRTLGDAQNRVTATGRPVTVRDGQTRIVGDEVQYNTKTGAGSVIGDASPILLEQPGRLSLTGGRLDFDRRQATAAVQGKGNLYAQVESASLTGTAEPPDATGRAAKEPSTLEATWTRGMCLEFYRLPAGAAAGTGEIKRASFAGQAVINQKDGILKGDELQIDFFRPEGSRGQAVERLVGHGDVFIKNDRPGKTAATEAQGTTLSAVGDIACQDLDLSFVRDASGQAQPKQLKASGKVTINDPHGTIRAEDLTVVFAPSTKGTTEAQFFEAIGNVLVKRDDLYAEGDHIRRDLANGTMLLTGKPARASRGESRIVGPTIEFAQADGRARVRGPGELEMPATTDLRGKPRARPEPMLIIWKNSMLFEDERNFAQFDGGVNVVTGGSRLDAERLWVYFADRPEPKAEAGQPRGDEMGQLFGRKALQRILAEKNVRTIEREVAADRMLQHQMEMTGDNLTYVESSRKAYIRGPGRLRILAREKTKPGESPAIGILPDAIQGSWGGPVPDGYTRMDVVWAESMAFDGAADRAYFKGDIEAVHTGRGVPGEEGTARRRPTSTRLKSSDLQVIFSEKPLPGKEATSKTSAAEAPRQDRMAVEKLVADGGVRLWVDDRQGSGQRLIYQREPEMIRLFRGVDAWARLWQGDEATQEFGEIVARVITYDPSTGRVDVVDQQAMTMAPKTKPRVRPGTKP